MIVLDLGGFLWILVDLGDLCYVGAFYWSLVSVVDICGF